MAHGDYDCCAVCDCKIRYSHDAGTKQEICIECLKELRSYNVNVLDPDELLRWADREEERTVRAVLKGVGFSACFYPNRVDDVLWPIMSGVSDGNA